MRKFLFALRLLILGAAPLIPAQIVVADGFGGFQIVEFGGNHV